ncbi:MAG TPA: 23S rRNA (uracil(1939)-C(5))-methyltransferase RlmD [Oculatellaceae cyanobacterium]
MSLPNLNTISNCGVDRWQQGELVEVLISDLADTGEGVGKLDNRVVFVPDTVTGDRALVRLVRVKPEYAHGKLHNLLELSPHRIRPSCIVADKCGGCQWQHIDYQHQLEAKHNQVIQALGRIGKFSDPTVAPVLEALSPLTYRNKATYPLGISATGHVQAGYYRKGTHQIVNLNQCPVQDERLNPLLAEVKEDIQRRGWQVYNEQQIQQPQVKKKVLNKKASQKTTAVGKVRHLSLRIGRRTGEMLLTLVVTDWNLPEVKEQALEWLNRYPQLVGVSLNYNPNNTNVIFGEETRTIAGLSYLTEKFAALQFQLRPDTFFQVYTEQAEALLEVIIEKLELQGNEVLLDAYCGIGTFTLPLAKHVKQAIGLEIHAASIEQARLNAEINGITNANFQVGAVEKLLPQLDIQPDIVLIDPPRKGCDRAVLNTLIEMQPRHIVYVSCKPATLARDLNILCTQGGYQLTYVQPADFFPQTSHVESAAFLKL